MSGPEEVGNLVQEDLGVQTNLVEEEVDTDKSYL